MTAGPRPLAYTAALGAVLLWIAFFLGPALPPGKALLAVDLLFRFPPWDARVAPDWEASNHLLFDQAAQFYPWRLVARRLDSAQLPPLWNPYSGTGSPLLANEQSATLAPIEHLVSGIDPPRAAVVASAVRLLVAGGGMILLAGSLGLSPAAALFSAIAFLGSGSIALLLYHPNANVSMWLPLAAWLSWRLARTGGPRTASLLALVLGAQLLGGHPETSLYVSFASVLFFVLGRGAAIAVAEKSQRAFSSWLLLAAAHVAGMGLAAPQTLPFLEYLREGAVLHLRSGERFFNPLSCAVGIFAPELFGTPDRPNTYFGPRNYHAVATQYAGLATLILAITAVARCGRSGVGHPKTAHRFIVLALAAAAAFSLFLVYPTPVWRLAGLFPPFRIAAHVTGLTLIFGFTASLLGGFGLDTIAGSRSARPAAAASLPRWLITALAAAAIVSLAAGLLLPLARDRLLAIGAEKLAERYAGVSHARSLAYYLDRVPLVFTQLQWTLIRTGLLGITLAALLGLGPRLLAGAISLKWVLGAGLILHLAMDLAHFGRGYVPAIPVAHVFPSAPEIDRLAHLPGIVRVLPTGRALPPNTLTAYGIEDFRVHDAVGSVAQSRFEAAMSSAPFLRRPLASYDRALLDVAGVDMVATEPSETATDSAGFTVVDRGAITLVRNDRAWPRAFFCAGARQGATDSEAAAAAGSLAALAASPPSEVVLTPASTGKNVASTRQWRLVRSVYPGLDRPPPPSLTRDDRVLAAGDSATIATGDSATIEIGRLTHTPLEVTADITAPADGWLVLLDQDFPGWEVQVDGSPGHSARAYGLFRTVQVTAGSHAVSWSYRPASFARGLGWAIAALVFTAAGFAAGERRDRSRSG